MPGDSRLRARVKLYGNILGEVIQEQAGKKVYTAVEMLRKGFVGLNKNIRRPSIKPCCALLTSWICASLSN